MQCKNIVPVLLGMVTMLYTNDRGNVRFSIGAGVWGAMKYLWARVKMYAKWMAMPWESKAGRGYYCNRYDSVLIWDDFRSSSRL